MRIMELVCKRCGYVWEPRIEGRPRNCPGCKSPIWDKEKGKVVRVESELAKRGLKAHDTSYVKDGYEQE
jgi:hypothetical protein